VFPTRTSWQNLLLNLAKSPAQTLVKIGRRFLPHADTFPQLLRMREITQETPIILQIETTNICNSACVFCAYPKMRREKGVMSLPLFEQIVNEYASMGGGSVSLTPLVGEALLDPHLLERLRILDECPQICQISFTTNAIALERYSDEEVRSILKVIDCIQVSLGGLDAAAYTTLYGVDRFIQVQRAMERLLTLKNEVADPPYINFAFRTNDWKFELRFRRQLKNYRQRGAFVSHIWTYANYAGLVRNDKSLKLEVFDGNMEKRLTCIYPAVHMAIGWDGRITACGCVDFEGTELRIGQAGKDSLSQVWSGKKRMEILDSFAAGKLHNICRECSAYMRDSAIYSKPFCRGITPHRPLPQEYFQQFWGG
jgi:radical SAM protein with 4Fe4S-binding SPASM domain